jgi:hypothetical protein
MPREQLEGVLRWLEGKSNPVLVQLPESTYDAQRTEWALP